IQDNYIRTCSEDCNNGCVNDSDCSVGEYCSMNCECISGSCHDGIVDVDEECDSSIFLFENNGYCLTYTLCEDCEINTYISPYNALGYEIADGLDNDCDGEVESKLWLDFDDADDPYSGQATCLGASCPIAIEGKIGSAADFDGINDYLIISNESDYDITGDMTITAWIKLDRLDKTQYIISKMDEGTSGAANHPFQFYITSTNKVLFYSGDGTDSVGGIYDAQSLAKDTWYHVAVVYDKDTGDVTTYLNGVGERYISDDGPIGDRINTDYDVKVGRTKFNNQWYYTFDGKIDDLRLYDRALSPEEIEWVYASVQNNNIIDHTPDIEDEADEPLGDSSLLAYYDFDGNADDKSGNGNDGIITGSVTYLQGAIGDALVFDNGVNDYIMIPNETNFDIAGDMTIIAWIKLGQLSTYQYLVTKMDEGTSGATKHPFQFGIDTNNRIIFFSGDGGSNKIQGIHNRQALAKDTWYHVAVVYDRDTGDVTTYLNGVGETDPNGPIDRANTDYNVKIGIGKFSNSLKYPFKGSIDNLMIYNRTLSADEINSLYSAITIINVDMDNDGYSEDVDCNDYNNAIHPGATESCDSIDNDCDGSIDEGGAISGCSTFYQDADNDGYGSIAVPICRCVKPSGYVTNSADCDDTNCHCHTSGDVCCASRPISPIIC
ncbi:MAG: LamG-like jellyroll fold domain-containing protein, partial [Nanoarchaeota archaeon]